MISFSLVSLYPVFAMSIPCCSIFLLAPKWLIIEPKSPQSLKIIYIPSSQVCIQAQSSPQSHSIYRIAGYFLRFIEHYTKMKLLHCNRFNITITIELYEYLKYANGSSYKIICNNENYPLYGTKKRTKI